MKEFQNNSIYPIEVRVDRGFYSFYELKRKYDQQDKRLVLDEDFQRKDVWSLQKKRELIESILLGLPLPSFYLNQDRYGRLIVVDGRQRLTAVFEFLDGKYRLNNLKILRELDKCGYEDLTPLQKGSIEDYQIQAHVIAPPTPERVKYDIFDRVNRGGVRLNSQEMRNALYQGYATRLLGTIVQSEVFRKVTGSAYKNDKRMKDRQLINRYLAVHMLNGNALMDEDGQSYRYKGDMDDCIVSIGRCRLCSRKS